MHTCYPRYEEKHKEEDDSPGWPGLKVRLNLKKYPKQKGLAQ
jgi:hypothetical protein